MAAPDEPADIQFVQGVNGRINDERLSHWPAWKEFDRANYFDILYWQDLPETLTDHYKNSCDLLFEDEFRWLSIKSFQLIFKYCEHRYSVAVRYLRAIIKAICLSYEIENLAKIKGYYVEFEITFPSGKTRRIRWKLLNWLQRFDNLYRHRNLNVAVIKEKQWEEYRHLRAAQLSGQTADDAIRARATELLDDADKIRVIKEVRQH